MFCSDVQEFEELGFRVPIELRQTAKHAFKFMDYARKLQQISNFHNTVGDRMIPCVRPIMLKNALELSNLVRSESVAWNDEESVERYVSMLQVSVNNLSRDNSILYEYHEKAKSIVSSQLPVVPTSNANRIFILNFPCTDDETDEHRSVATE